jgi:hypothetical protein
MRSQPSTIPHSTARHSLLDRLPAPDVFYRQNVEGYRRYGNRGRGVCPFCQSLNRGRFHSKPFSVDLTRSLFHCFKCDAGGDIVKFVMLRDSCTFIEAAKKLGALRPLDPVEAEAYRRDRDAKQARQQRKDDDFYEWLQLLLKEMKICEGVRDWAFQCHHDELYDLAEQAIDAVGGDYVLLKAGML